MKRFAFLSFPAGFLVFLAAWAFALPEIKVLHIPKGTSVQAIEPGHFKLKSPGGCVMEVTGFQKAKGQPADSSNITGDCVIFDPAGKIVAKGTLNVLKGSPKPETGVTPAKAPAADYVKIDDEVTWLPATIEFQPIRIFNRQLLLKLCEAPAGNSGR